MIGWRVSAVLRLRDSFLGRPVEGAAALCRLDGQPCRPQIKRGGYLVWTDLPDGAHRLHLEVPGFQPEVVELCVRAGSLWEGAADLKPGAGYPHQEQAVHAVLRLTRRGQPLAHAAVWLALADNPPLKLAQAKGEAGTTQLRLFCKGSARMLPVPGAFVLEDRAPELVHLRQMDGETGYLAEPLAAAHARGKALLPAQRYHTDGEGALRLMLRAAGRLAVFDGALHMAELPPEGGIVSLELE